MKIYVYLTDQKSTSIPTESSSQVSEDKKLKLSEWEMGNFHWCDTKACSVCVCFFRTKGRTAVTDVAGAETHCTEWTVPHFLFPDLSAENCHMMIDNLVVERCRVWVEGGFVRKKP